MEEALPVEGPDMPSPRRSKRGRWLTWLTILTGLGVTVLFVIEERLTVLELWILSDLDTLELEVKKTRIGDLSRFGSDRSARKFIELLEDAEIEAEAVTALASVFPRTTRTVQSKVIAALWDLILSKNDREIPGAYVDAFQALGLAHGHLLDQLVSLLETTTRFTPRTIVSRVVFQYWAEDPGRVEAILAGSTLKQVTGLLLPPHLPPQRLFGPSPWAQRKDFEFPFFTEGKKIARLLLETHSDEHVRAVALSFLVFEDRVKNDFLHDGSVLKKAYYDDSNLVKRTALRLTGYVGPLEGGLELGDVLQREDDPELLTEIVQALTVWRRHRNWGSREDGLELWENFICFWVPKPRDRMEKWSKTEIERIEMLLVESSHPPLRDACSLALASRYRGSRLGERPAPMRVKGFKYHEWGVWKDGGKGLQPPPEALADLPAFVHRSETSRSELASQRSFLSMSVYKPVVHFYTPQPISALVQIGFRGGQPWTFFPEPTDYLHTFSPSGRGVLSPLVSPPAPGSPSAPLISALPGVGVRAVLTKPTPGAASDLPPWMKRVPAKSVVVVRSGWRRREPPPVPGGELQRRYQVVPWLIPNHPRSGVRSGAPVLADLGLEWCGLRIGYDTKLEAAIPELTKDSWWSHLRQVGSASVAVRNQRESFLFYDGAIAMPSPVTVTWESEARDAVLMRVTSFAHMPYKSYVNHWWFTDAERQRMETASAIPAVFVVRVKDGVASGAVREQLLHEDAPRRLGLSDLTLDESALRARFTAVLEAQGLTATEARSLVACWDTEFFRTEGLRLLTLLPSWMYGGALPLTIHPVPDEIVRVGVIWKECDQLATGAPPADPDRLPPWKEVQWEMPELLVEASVQAHAPGQELRLKRDDGTGEVIVDSGEPGLPALDHDGSKVAFGVEGETDRVLLADLERSTVSEVVRMDPGLRPTSTSISGDGRWLAYNYGKANFWRFGLIDFERELRFDFGEMTGARLSANGRTLLCWSPPKLLAIALSTMKAMETKDGERQGTVSFEARVVVEQTARPWWSSITHEVIAGDGRHVAFSWGGTIYLFNLDRATVLNVSRGKGFSSNVKISRDGSRLLWECDWERDEEIFFADIEKQTLTNLTRRRGEDRFCDLSGDGSRYIYRDWDARTWYLVDRDTGIKRKIKGTGGVWNMKISVTGDRLCMVRRRGKEAYICVVEVEAP